MTHYVSPNDLMRHVGAGHDVFLVHADTDDLDRPVIAAHCNEPGCEWIDDHLVVGPLSDTAPKETP